MTVATLVTLSRLALVVPVALLTLNGTHTGLAVALFCLAASTDYLDGAIARRFSQITPLGARLDATVDKIFIYFSLLFLSLQGAYFWPIVAVAFSRDATVEIARYASARKNRVLSANRWGKSKFVLQCISITAALASRGRGAQTGYILANGFLLTAIIVSVPGLFMIVQSATEYADPRQPNSSQQPTRGRSLARRFRASFLRDASRRATGV